MQVAFYYIVMKMPDKILKCYIASYLIRDMDAALNNFGVSKGIISFAIPNFGLIFRARAEGYPLDMEIGVFFSLLEFIKSKLAEEKIKQVAVFSSKPQFVFSFTAESTLFTEGSSRRELLDKYTALMKLSVSYVKPIQNQALISPADYPSLPKGQEISIPFSDHELNGVEFKPLQTGLKL